MTLSKRPGVMIGAPARASGWGRNENQPAMATETSISEHQTAPPSVGAASKKRGLGRGLAALLPTTPATQPTNGGGQSGSSASSNRPRDYFEAPIDEIHPSPEQPRRKFDEKALEELAQSIRAVGIIQAIVVRERPAKDGGGYYLIAGERRWRAAQRAGYHRVPVVVQKIEPTAAFERALVENLQREDLNAIEEAEAYHRLSEEYELTQEQIAVRVGKDRSTVANSLRLLRLPPKVREMVEEGSISMGHARALLGLDSPAAMETIARTVSARALSVRSTEAMIRKRKGASEAAPSKKQEDRAKSPAVRDLEQRLTQALGAPVCLKEDKRKGSGLIEVRYLDLDHLDRLLERLLEPVQ